jgi:hypothetical protein
MRSLRLGRTKEEGQNWWGEKRFRAFGLQSKSKGEEVTRHEGLKASRIRAEREGKKVGARLANVCQIFGILGKCVPILVSI